MTENLRDRKIGHFVESILKYAVLTILSPLFLLLAIVYVHLYPDR
jgi:hypothetical protein